MDAGSRTACNTHQSIPHLDVVKSATLQHVTFISETNWTQSRLTSCPNSRRLVKTVQMLSNTRINPKYCNHQFCHLCKCDRNLMFSPHLLYFNNTRIVIVSSRICHSCAKCHCTTMRFCRPEGVTCFQCVYLAPSWTKALSTKRIAFLSWHLEREILETQSHSWTDEDIRALNKTGNAHIM